MKLLPLFLFILFYSIAPASAAVRYVDSAAPAGGNGQSWATAWQHPSQVSGVGAGDIVYISGGSSGKSYGFTGGWNPPDGVAGNPVIIRNGRDPGHRGVVTFESQGAGELLNRVSYVRFEFWDENTQKLKFTGSTKTGFYVLNDGPNISNEFTLLGAEFTQFGIRMYDSRKVEIGYCLFNSAGNKLRGGPGWVVGLGRWDTTGWGNNKFHHNELRLLYLHGVDANGKNGDDGMQNLGAMDIYDNRFISKLTTGFAGDNHQDGIQTDGPYFRIYNNYFENISNYMIYYETWNDGTQRDVQIFNNVFNYSDPVLTGQPSQAIAIGGHNSGTKYDGFQIFNNTFRGGNQAIAMGDTNGTILASCHFVNNLRGPGAGGINLHGTVQGVVSNNVQQTNSDAFVNLAAGNLRLTDKATLAINKGTNAFVDTITTKDADGKARSVPWDIGAYEFGGVAPSPTPTPPPTPSPSPTATPTPGPSPSPTATPSPTPSPEVPLMPGLTFEAKAGLVEAPFEVDAEGTVSQSSQTTDPSSGGRVRWKVNIPQAGEYVVRMKVQASGDNTNSAFVDFDQEPVAPTAVWDVQALTQGIEARAVSWRGNGDPNAPEQDPRVWQLTTGEHTLYLRGREANMLFASVNIAEAAGPTPTPTPSPSPSPTPAPSPYPHQISDIEGLQEALDGKADKGHTH